jgi:hypothetical protein
MSRREDIAWAAGLFEGEGTVGTQETAERIRVRFALAMTDEDVVRRFRRILGVGHVNGPNWHKGSTKPQWRWSATKRADVAIVSDLLYPFLGERRRNALERAWHAFANQPEPRRHKSEKTHCPQGHPYVGQNLVHRDGEGRRCAECERQRSYRKNRGLHADAPVPARSYSKKSRKES